jgi:hypothetical protein
MQRHTCFTFDIADPPVRVFPDRVFVLGGIGIRDVIGPVNGSAFSYMSVQVMLAKKPFNESSAILTGNATFNANATINSNATFNANASAWTFPLLKLPRGIVEPANDFVWALKMVEPIATDVVVIFDSMAVTVLDVDPVIQTLSTLDVPFTGSNFSVECVPSSPSTSFFLPLLASSNNSNASNTSNAFCEFLPLSPRLVPFSQPAQFSVISPPRIALLCMSFTSGQLGPPYSTWRVRVVFPDGRESAASAQSLVVHCPAGMYIEVNVTLACKSPPCCFACPSPMSISLSINGVSSQACLCQRGYYGTGGLSCKACPVNAKYGFICTTVGLLLPSVKPGFYIDHGLLHKCSEESCSAVVKCQNERACPGLGSKSCLMTETECYDSSAFGCVKCCRGFFLDNFVCRPCPSAQLPLMLGLALLALILFVGISSSVDFPPILSVVSGMRVFIKGMQSFVGIRLFDVPWPSIVLQMFDFTRFFTFSLDVLRPECASLSCPFVLF